MACGGCAGVRRAGVAALSAIAAGDAQALDAAIGKMRAIEAEQFAAHPLKASATRTLAASLARLSAKAR